MKKGKSFQYSTNQTLPKNTVEIMVPLILYNHGKIFCFTKKTNIRVLFTSKTYYNEIMKFMELRICRERSCTVPNFDIDITSVCLVL